MAATPRLWVESSALQSQGELDIVRPPLNGQVTTMTQVADAGHSATTETQALLAVYAEICKSYHAIDDFRMKLLGLLPLTSVAGILLLNIDTPTSTGIAGTPDLVAFAAVFASAFTLSLFVYEIRGILRCDGLIKRGREIEDALTLRGQFWQCEDEAGRAPTTLPQKLGRFINTTVAACTVYSLVFAAWVFLALRYGYGLAPFGCAALAATFGIVVGLLAYLLVRKVIPA
jgi:hypothetical protein